MSAEAIAEIEEISLEDWLVGKSLSFESRTAASRHAPNAITRLQLSGRTENALMRADVRTLSLLIDIVNLPERPPIRNLGAKGWAEIEAALDRPLPRMDQSGDER